LAFQDRLARLQPTPNEALAPAEPDKPANDDIRCRIDKSVLTLPEAKRQRDRQHLRFVAQRPASFAAASVGAACRNRAKTCHMSL